MHSVKFCEISIALDSSDHLLQMLSFSFLYFLWPNISLVSFWPLQLSCINLCHVHLCFSQLFEVLINASVFFSFIQVAECFYPQPLFSFVSSWYLFHLLVLYTKYLLCAGHYSSCSDTTMYDSKRIPIL